MHLAGAFEWYKLCYEMNELVHVHDIVHIEHVVTAFCVMSQVMNIIGYRDAIISEALISYSGKLSREKTFSC